MTSEISTGPVCYYDVLQVSQRCSDDEVKQAYRRLAMVYHPDLNPQNRSVAELRFRLINEAYASLKTRERRVRYNHKKKTMTVIRPENDNRAGAASSWFEQLAALFRSAERQDSKA